MPRVPAPLLVRCTDTKYVTIGYNTRCVMGEETQRMIKLVCLPIVELSRELQVPYDTVRGWSSGRADNPSPENRKALAAFMRAHAKKLVAAAEQLEE